MSLVLFPMYWFMDYFGWQFFVINRTLLYVVIIGGLAHVTNMLLGLMGIPVYLASRGERQPQSTLAPLSVTARRVVISLVRPLSLIALPPFSFPAETTVGTIWLNLIKIGNVVFCAAYIVLLFFNKQPGFVSYALIVNSGIASLIGLLWLIAWSTRRVVAPVLKIALDIFRYVGDPDYRNSLQYELDKKILKHQGTENSRLIVLLAHSLGTIIAADSLINSKAWRPQDDVLLVTMGSPLRRFFFRFFPGVLFPVSADAIGDAVAARVASFRWANVYRPLDQVGAALRFTNAGSVERSTEQWSRFLNAHTDYWSNASVRDIILNVVSVRDIVLKTEGALSSWRAREGLLPTQSIIPSLPSEPAFGRVPHIVYFSMAACLLLTSFIGFGIASGLSKSHRDADFERIHRDLELHGSSATADVLYTRTKLVRIKQVYEYDYLSQKMVTKYKPEEYYYDSFNFQIKPDGRAPLIRIIGMVEDDPFEFMRDVQMFINLERLRDDIYRRGKVEGEENSYVSTRRLDGIRLVYDPKTFPVSGWFLLPDYPDESKAFRSGTEWVIICILTVFSGIASFLILSIGRLCVQYFIGPSPFTIGGDPKHQRQGSTKV